MKRFRVSDDFRTLMALFYFEYIPWPESSTSLSVSIYSNNPHYVVSRDFEIDWPTASFIVQYDSNVLFDIRYAEYDRVYNLIRPLQQRYVVGTQPFVSLERMCAVLNADLGIV